MSFESVYMINSWHNDWIFNFKTSYGGKIILVNAFERGQNWKFPVLIKNVGKTVIFTQHQFLRKINFVLLLTITLKE